MGDIIEIAKIYNIIEARLSHTPLPVTASMFLDMPELAPLKHRGQKYRLIDALKALHKSGKIRKVAANNPDNTRDRVGYEWVSMADREVQKLQRDFKTGVGRPDKNEVDDLRIKINNDRSVSIITSKIRITIEVPV